MTAELNSRIKNLKLVLYKENEEIANIDRISIQKNLFSLIRECIKEREYIVEIGSYEINVSPSNLYVKYENDETVIEISSDDVYYETSRETECRYFIISNEYKKEYPRNTSVIKVTGLVTNVDGDSTEFYEFELITDKEDNIKNYLTLSNFNVSGAIYSSESNSNYSAIIKKEVDRNSQRTDVIDFFLPNAVIPVTYNLQEDKYIREDNKRRIYNPNDYRILIPNIDDKKNIVNFIYSSIVEYYTEYINNNL